MVEWWIRRAHRPTPHHRPSYRPKIDCETSSLWYSLKVESLPWFRISKFVAFRNSNNAAPLSLQLVLPHTVWCEWSCTLWVDRGFSHHNETRVPQTTFSGEGRQICKADKQSRKPSAFLSHLHYNLLELLQGFWKRIPVATICSCSPQGYTL